MSWVGEWERARQEEEKFKSNVILIFMYLRCQDLRQQSPGSDFQEHKTPTDKVEEREFPELCKVLVSIFQ